MGEVDGQNEVTERSDPDDRTGRTGRRAFLAGAGAAAGALALGAVAACSDPNEASGSDGSDGGSSSAGVGGGAAGEPIPFRSDRQLGVLRQPAAAGLVATFDVLVGSAAELAETMQALSVEVERLMTSAPAADADAILPPPDSGVVGAEPAPAGVSITVAVGASIFDGRFGLAERRPRELIEMPRFFNDRLVRPELSHGDLAVMVAADRPQAAVHALHQIVRATERLLGLRWVQEGYNDLLDPGDGIARSRNLMGFRDGTSNLDTADDEMMDEHVWVRSDDQEPAWAVGGSYVAVRVIRMLIEFWATAALVRQEQIVGRHRESGAPLGQDGEGEEPLFAEDPSDQVIPVRSHMRLANPRRPETGRILRRGFNYLNGADAQGTLDQGLLFLAFQRSMTRGFLEVQSRLDGEPMEDYIKPVGGGFYFVLPGPGDDGWLGQSLLAG